jgi:hypothetical protein
MLDAFRKRETAFENKFAYDEELRFKIQSRRDWLFGHWAAKEMGYAGVAADIYAKELVDLDIECVGNEEVIQKVCGDFADHKHFLPVDELRRVYDKLWADAKRQVMAH